MKQRAASGAASICFLAACASIPIAAQQHPASQEAAAIRVQSSLVLIDVISQDPKNALPVRDFKKEDFRVFDNRQEVPITTFAAGAHDTRPIVLWLVVICNESGKSEFEASGAFMGKEGLFRPALDHLEKQDIVGVAHWCDNGETQLDLQPTDDCDGAIRVLAETLKPIPFQIGGDSDAVGEVTFRKMIRSIIRDAHRRNPQPLPVIAFLHGDYTGQPHRALDELVDDFLETSGIVFGIKDYRSPNLHLVGEQSKILQYMAKQTGGLYFSAPPSEYAVALEAILAQLHYRYELGFIPPALDGKRHELRVVLTKEAKREHKGIRLRFRPEYIPVRKEPEWAH